MIDLNAFPGTRADAELVVRSLLAPLTAAHDGDGHAHEYMILLAEPETGVAYELNRVQAPCAVTDQQANLTAIINTLRETADEIAAAHADILYPVPAHVEPGEEV
jgi:hypothetical protein